MRNNALDDWQDTTATLSTEKRSGLITEKRDKNVRLKSAKQEAPMSTAPLWVAISALLIGFLGLAWWGLGQIESLNQQLVATQKSFAATSEQAEGRIKDISGKVVATESSAVSESKALKLQVSNLNKQLTALDQRTNSLNSDQSAQKTSLQQSLAQLKLLQANQDQLPALQKGLSTLAAQIEALKQENKQLQQELLVVRSSIENTNTPSATRQEFDAFRAQITRTLNTLQQQLNNLQSSSTTP